MNRHLLAILFLAFAAPAQALDFEKGSVKMGKLFFEQHCKSCHVDHFGGDGSGVFTRPDHEIRSVEELARQIGRCNDASHAELSEQQQRDVGAYLNQAFYRF
jgi:mono/diheme cytochrome c family protein